MPAPSCTPAPTNVGSIVLSDELLALGERLSENTHGIWAAGRMAQAWTSGPARD